MNSRNLVIFDLDDTLILGQSQKKLLAYLKKEKYIGMGYFLRIYFWFILYKLSIVDDPKKIFQYAIAFLKDRSVDDVKGIITLFVNTQLRYSFNKQIVALLDKHKENGDYILILSNAIEPVVNCVSVCLKTNNFLSTELSIKNGKYTGTIQGDIAYGEGKVAKIRKYINDSNLSYDEIFVYTDHHSDEPLLKFATKPCAVNPTRQLKAISQKQGWKIIITS